MNVNQLLQLCHLDAIYKNTFEFRVNEELDCQREFKIDVKVLQEKNESSISATSCFKDVSYPSYS